jgi:hypothetical protein
MRSARVLARPELHPPFAGRCSAPELLAATDELAVAPTRPWSSLEESLPTSAKSRSRRRSRSWSLTACSPRRRYRHHPARVAHPPSSTARFDFTRVTARVSTKNGQFSRFRPPNDGHEAVPAPHDRSWPPSGHWLELHRLEDRRGVRARRSARIDSTRGSRNAATTRPFPGDVATTNRFNVVQRLRSFLRSRSC